MTKRKTALIAAIAIAVAGVGWTTALAFDPQPDPPAFGMMSILPGDTIQLHVVCSEHGVGRFPPSPCAAQLMFHDALGDTLAKDEVRLEPGEAATLEFALDRGSEIGGRVGIIPCVIPDPLGGRVLPTAEVFDTESGRTMVFANPLAPRLSLVQALFNAGQ